MQTHTGTKKLQPRDKQLLLFSGWQRTGSRRRGIGKFFQHPAAEKRPETPQQKNTHPLLLFVPSTFALFYSSLSILYPQIIHSLLQSQLQTVQTRKCVLEEISSPKCWYMHKKRVPQKSVAESTKKSTTIHFNYNIISFPLHTTNTRRVGGDR